MKIDIPKYLILAIGNSTQHTWNFFFFFFNDPPQPAPQIKWQFLDPPTRPAGYETTRASLIHTQCLDTFIVTRLKNVSNWHCIFSLISPTVIVYDYIVSVLKTNTDHTLAHAARLATVKASKLHLWSEWNIVICKLQHIWQIMKQTALSVPHSDWLPPTRRFCETELFLTFGRFQIVSLINPTIPHWKHSLIINPTSPAIYIFMYL